MGRGRALLLALFVSLVAALSGGAQTASDRTLRIGTMVAPPFAMLGADGSWDGLSVALLAEVAGRHLESLRTHLGEELLVDEVDLAQVRLGRVLCDPGAVLDRDAGMDVALHAEPGEQCDTVPVRLGERVLAVAADGRHCPAHSHSPLLDDTESRR